MYLFYIFVLYIYIILLYYVFILYIYIIDVNNAIYVIYCGGKLRVIFSVIYFFTLFIMINNVKK